MIPALHGSTSVIANAVGGLSVILAGGSASHTNTTDPYSGLKFDRDGKVYRNVTTSSASWTYYQNWISVPEVTIGDGYEIRATYASGLTNPPNSLNAGLGSWLPLSTDRVWENVDGVKLGEIEVTTTLTIEIRPTSGAVEGSADYTIYALKI